MTIRGGSLQQRLEASFQPNTHIVTRMHQYFWEAVNSYEHLRGVCSLVLSCFLSPSGGIFTYLYEVYCCVPPHRMDPRCKKYTGILSENMAAICYY